jgi:hypothetical protein
VTSMRAAPLRFQPNSPDEPSTGVTNFGCTTEAAGGMPRQRPAHQAPQRGSLATAKAAGRRPQEVAMPLFAGKRPRHPAPAQFPRHDPRPRTKPALRLSARGALVVHELGFTRTVHTLASGKNLQYGLHRPMRSRAFTAEAAR